jgi:pinoresinol/lariciresinol reductase
MEFLTFVYFLFINSEQNYAEQVGLTHYYHVCYEGCLTNFEIGNEGVEACQLCPEIKYTTVEEYLRRYL